MRPRVLTTRVIGAAAVAALTAAAAYNIGIQLWGGASARYEPTTWLVVAAAVAGACAIAGLRLASVGPVSIAALAALTTFAIGFGLIAIFSVGLPILIVGLILLAYLIRRLRGQPAIRPTIQGGVAIGLVLWVAAMVALEAPVVRCQAHGAEILSGYGPGGGVVVSADGRTATGTIRLESKTVQFRCQDGRLVDYQTQ